MEFKDIVTLNESEKEFLKKLHDTLGDEEWMVDSNILIIANSIKRITLLRSGLSGMSELSKFPKSDIETAFLNAISQIVMSTMDIVNYGLSEDERIELNESIHFQLSQTNGVLEKAEMLKKSKEETEMNNHVYTNIVQ